MGTAREVRAWLLAGMVGIAAVAAWCVWVVVSTSALRGQVESNVGLLNEVLELRGALEAPDADRAARSSRAAALAARIAARVPAAAGDAQALVRAVDVGGPGDTSAAADAVVRSIRAENRAVSVALGDRWRYLYVVAGVVIALAAALLVVVRMSHRRRLRAEASEASLRRRDQLLRGAAHQWAAGDLATPVPAVGEADDGFGEVLESLRQALLRDVEELNSRNREVAELAEDLRAQLVDKSELVAALLTPSSGAALEPGRIVARRYLVLRSIGQGGMGTVYEVRRLTDARVLALKVMREGFDPRRRARFLREARLLTEIQHPNVVRILDVDVDEGQPFLVTELIEGKNLREGEPWARPLVLPILRDIADGLVAIHARGIVHRDLKLANVMVTQGESGAHAKIVDFGIARGGDPGGQEDAEPAGEVEGTLETGMRSTPSTVVRHGLTESGLVIGTLRYLAPECQDPSAVSAASDVFAFGVVAAWLAFGEFPWEVPPVRQVANHGRLPPPRLPERDDIPASVRSLIERCLAPAPNDRPQATQLRVALDALASRSGTDG